MEDFFVVDNDTDVSDVIGKINTLLEPHGLSISEYSSGDGWCKWFLDDRSSLRAKVKEMIEAAEDYDVILDIARLVGADTQKGSE